MKPLSQAVGFVTRQNFSRKFIALGKIASEWPQIIGANLAAKSQPVRINYRKPKTNREAPQVVLEIASSGADSTLLHYQKDLILERLNQIFGERWISDIKFVISSAPASGASKLKRKLPSEARKKDLEQSLAQIADEEIRGRLLALGCGILSKEQQN